jgi:hypothetical protein
MRPFLVIVATLPILACCDGNQPATQVGQSLDNAGAAVGEAVGHAAAATGQALDRAGNYVNEKINPNARGQGCVSSGECGSPPPPVPPPPVPSPPAQGSAGFE